MTFAIVKVLPEPVTPSSVWYFIPASKPAVSFAIASGWSPVGANGECKRNGCVFI